MKHSFLCCLSFFWMLVVAGQKYSERTMAASPGKIKTVTQPDGTVDNYSYDGQGRIVSLYHARNGYTDTYIYYPGYYEVVAKDSAKNPAPGGGYLRYELVNILISSFKTGPAGSGPKSETFAYDNNGRLISRKLTPGSWPEEEYRYFYSAKNVLDSMHVYTQNKLKQRVIYEYDYKLPNALTDKDFGLIYQGTQTAYPVSRRFIYNGTAPAPAREYYKYELDSKNRIQSMTVSSSVMKEQQTTRYTYY